MSRFEGRGREKKGNDERKGREGTEEEVIQLYLRL